MSRMQIVKRVAMHPLLRSNGFFFISTAVVGLANYLLSTTTARHFAPGDYSQFGVVLNLTVMFLPLTSAMISVVVRQASYNRASDESGQTAAIQRSLVRLLSLLFTVVLSIIVIAQVPIGHFFKLTMTKPLYFIVIIAYWQFVQGVLQAILQEEGRYWRICVAFVSEGIFRAIVGITAIVLGFSVSVILTVYALSAALAAFLLPRPTAFWVGAGVPLRILTPLFREMGPLTLANSCFAFLTALDVVLCRRYLAPVSADQYVALAAMAKFFLFATGSVSSIAFAEVVKAAHRGQSSARPLGISLGLIVVLGVPFTIFCVLFGPFVMNFAFGSAFRASGHLLWITAIGAFAVSFLNLEVAYFNARHWLRYLPILVLGCVAAVAALPLAHRSLQRYAGIYATGTMMLALIFLIPLLVMFNQDRKLVPVQTFNGVGSEDRLGLRDAGNAGVLDG